MFSGCWSLVELDVSSWNTESVTSMNHTFSGARSLEYIDVSDWDVSNVRSMTAMFSSTGALNGIDVSLWNTERLVAMDRIFDGASSLTSIDVSRWNTSLVTTTSSAFAATYKLTSLDINDWDTSSLTNASWMFSSAQSLTSLDLSQWNTSQLRDIYSMFASTHQLESLNVSGWDTSKIINAREAFKWAYNLTNLDLSSWDMSNVTEQSGMFESTKALKEIIFGPKFKIIESDIFYGSIAEYLPYKNEWHNIANPGYSVGSEMMTEVDFSSHHGTWKPTFAPIFTVDVVEAIYFGNVAIGTPAVRNTNLISNNIYSTSSGFSVSGKLSNDLLEVEVNSVTLDSSASKMIFLVNSPGSHSTPLEITIANTSNDIGYLSNDIEWTFTQIMM